MLRPVEFHAPRDPRAQQPHQRGLDDVLAVEEVVAVGPVEPDVNAAADLGEDHQPQVLVLKMNGGPGPLDRLVRDAVDDRVRVDAP
jgi:hypothetical protein